MHVEKPLLPLSAFQPIIDLLHKEQIVGYIEPPGWAGDALIHHGAWCLFRQTWYKSNSSPGH